MKLICKATGEPAVIGQMYAGFILKGFRPPHKPSSSGKCWTADNREFFVGVLGLEWIDREDRKTPPAESVSASGVGGPSQCT